MPDWALIFFHCTLLDLLLHIKGSYQVGGCKTLILCEELLTTKGVLIAGWGWGSRHDVGHVQAELRGRVEGDRERSTQARPCRLFDERNVWPGGE